MMPRKKLALASIYALLFTMTFAEEENAKLSPIIDWGSASISSYSYVSTLPVRVADQQAPPSPPSPPQESPQGQQPPPAQPAQPTQPARKPFQPSPGSSGSATTPTAGPPPVKTDSGTPKAGSPTGSNSAPSGTPPPKGGTGSGTTSRSAFNWTPASSLPPFYTGTSETPPDVLLQVPTVGVKRIELDVDQLSADINLNAQVAGLVQLNAGIHASIQSVNLTISDIGAELELVIRLGHLADIVNRVFQSLDLVLLAYYPMKRCRD
jgi:hypothetical protein